MLRKGRSICWAVGVFMWASLALAQVGTAPTAPHVKFFSLASRTFGNRRTIRVFLPPGYEHSRRDYPVLYLNDGFAVFKDTAWDAPAIAQRLMEEGKIAEFILVGMDNGATAEPGSVEQRTREYLPFPDAENEPEMKDPKGSLYPEFLLNEVMPEVEKRFHVSRKPEDTGIGGASYGGLVALYTVIHHNQRFGLLLLESTPLFMAQGRILNEATGVRQWPSRVYIGIGTKETDDPSLNNGSVPNIRNLEGQIHKVSPLSNVKVLVEEGGTHESSSWRRRLPVSLEFLFPAKKPATER